MELSIQSDIKNLQKVSKKKSDVQNSFVTNSGVINGEVNTVADDELGGNVSVK